MKKLIAPSLLLPLLFILVTGMTCRQLEPGGVYDGDKLLYESESLVVDGYDALHSFVIWEKENRALIQRPKVTEHANYVRANAKKWITSLIELRNAYVGAPNEENRKKLEQAADVIRAALAQALIYMQKPKPN